MIYTHLQRGIVVVLILVLSYNSLQAHNINMLNLSIDQDKLVISHLDQPRLLYCFRSVPAKPYVKRLTSPGGINVLRDAPHDHLHHHGLMFAFIVNDIDFWAENETAGQQIHTSFQNVDVSSENQNEVASFTDVIEWMDPSSEKILLKEQRELILKQSKQVTLLTWHAFLKTAGDISEVTITGSHYHGLGMRFLQSMDQDGTFQNAVGKTGDLFRGTERLTSATWCAYHAVADGKPVTVAMFDHPNNFCPVTWFTMTQPFSYLSATLKYHDNTYTLHASDNLSLIYGIAVWDGKIDKPEIEQTYRTWLKQTTHTGDKK